MRRFTLIRSLTAMPTTLPATRTLRATALAVVLGAVGTACTDLTENPPSRITPQSFFQNDAQVQAALAGVYNGLRSAEADYWQISQNVSDETITPTRGSDWDDLGKWRELWQHTYGPATAAAGQGQPIDNAYSGISSAIAKANAVLDALSSVNTPAATQGTAEARALRAYFYYMLQDAFGGVPIITKPGVSGVPRASRDSTIRFILSELYAARPNLPAKYDAGGQGRITQGAVDAILCDLYLNYHVYTGQPSANGITFNTTTRYDSAIAVANRIINSGNYTLNPDITTWRAQFAYNNQGNQEHIFVVRNQALDGLGLDFINRATHYNHFKNSGGWNGFSMIADTYNQFDANDGRRSIILFGPQRSLDTGDPITTRAGAPLVLTHVQSLGAAAEPEGARVVKFTFDPNHIQQNMGNDYTLFRLGGIYMNRAEAYYRSGNTAAALADFNRIRARAYSTAAPLTSLSDAVVLRERLNELTNEGKRRQDMIRFGVFTAPKQFKTTTSPPYSVLFPIPRVELQANAALTQNPGYPQ